MWTCTTGDQLRSLVELLAINCDQGEGEGDQLRSERAIKGDQNVVVYI